MTRFSGWVLTWNAGYATIFSAERSGAPGMKASEKLEERNEFIRRLRNADAQLRAEGSKAANDPTKISDAAFERGVSKREYIANKLRELGAEPWPFNPETADFDSFAPFRGLE
jgi:hypothetical protein